MESWSLYLSCTYLAVSSQYLKELYNNLNLISYCAPLCGDGFAAVYFSALLFLERPVIFKRATKLLR